jgi:hypothetical protein
MTLLPAGATLTAGYLRPADDEDLAFQVRVTSWSLRYSLIGDVVDALSGQAAGAAGRTTLYLLARCSGAVDYGSLSVHNPLSTLTFGSAMKCVISQALSGLSSPAKAAGAARSLLGPGVDEADLASAVTELTSVGGKLVAFGWVLQLWPVFQLGWGGIADVVHHLLTGGTSTLIDLHLRAAPSTCPSSAQLLNAWNTAPTRARKPWAAPGISITGFVGISCWDNWVVAVPVADGNGWFIFSQQSRLHILSPSELQQFTKAVCSTNHSPASWKSIIQGPANCNP